ncbi:TPA: hypothetical protein ACPY6L_000598, partial [Yersinia enterocolitica]
MLRTVSGQQPNGVTIVDNKYEIHRWGKNDVRPTLLSGIFYEYIKIIIWLLSQATLISVNPTAITGA